MAKNKEKTYWPHMILGFLFLGVTLGYWTVKSASSMPVQESNDYMSKYQITDININEMMGKKIAFDKQYKINITGVETIPMQEHENLHRKYVDPVKLSKGVNHFSYEIVNQGNTPVLDANVSFLLTRPHTRADDIMLEQVSVSEGKYITNDIEIMKAGRYTLQLRAKIGEAIGYSEIPAYLKPE